MSWLNIDSIVCFVVLIQTVVIVYQQVTHRKTVVQLIDRIMAKNYGEIVQGQVLIKTTDVDKQGEVKLQLPVEDNDQNSVDMLNKLL